MISGPGRREPRAHHVEMWTGQMQRLRGSQQPVGMRWWDSGRTKPHPSCLLHFSERQARQRGLKAHCPRLTPVAEWAVSLEASE